MEFKRFNTNPEDNESIAHYYGLLASYTDFANASPAEKDMNAKIIAISGELSAMFNPKAEKLFREFEEATEVMQSYLYEQCFIEGFKTAMRLAVESFT